MKKDQESIQNVQGMNARSQRWEEEVQKLDEVCPGGKWKRSKK